jgi:surfeit locus 1 family protein
VRLKLAAWIGLSLAGVGILLSLGVWQVERRAWKLDLIDRVERRIHAAPAAMPGPWAWPSINAADDAYRRVRLRGQFANGKDTLVKAVTELGSGYWVLTPLETGDGSAVLVNRGFVADEGIRAARPAGTRSGEVEVTGLLRITEPGGAFLRSNDPAHDRWYSRDVAAIAQARGVSQIAPFFIDADAGSGPPGGPVGGLTVVAFRNNHLVYALTWFALAAMLAGWTAYLVRQEWRPRESRLNVGGKLRFPSVLSGRLFRRGARDARSNLRFHA